MNRFKFIHSFEELISNSQALEDYLCRLNAHIEYLEKEFSYTNKYRKRNSEIIASELREYNHKHNTNYYWYGGYLRSLYLHREKLLKKVSIKAN